MRATSLGVQRHPLSQAHACGPPLSLRLDARALTHIRMHTHAHLRALSYACAGIAGIQVPRLLMLVRVDVSVR